MYTLYIGNKNQAKKKGESQSNLRSNAKQAEQVTKKIRAKRKRKKGKSILSFSSGLHGKA
jgi:hypothetical protein